MDSPRVLIVDDEPNIRLVLKRALSREGCDVDTAENGAEALKKLSEITFDLILLDLFMEPVGGLQVLEAARELDPEIVVIILTAHGSVESAVEALRLGAFDYLFKPSTPEAIRKCVQEGLHQRQQGLQRRHLLAQIDVLRQLLDDLDVDVGLGTSPKVETRFITSAKLLLDRNHRIATWDDKLLDLTTTEFALLVCLVDASPTPMTPRQLVSQAMGYDVEDSEARDIVKWHIHKLRKKIEPDMKKPRFIVTVRYEGYLWRGE